MKRAGTIGWPLKASLSPVFQQAALNALELSVRFEAWPTPPESLNKQIEQLRRSDCAGACVTVPYKQVVMPSLDNIDDKARAIGAVNWIVNKHGKLFGYNTDVDGFVTAIREKMEFSFEGKSVLVFGAGGAARAVIYGLRLNRVRAVAIVNRTIKKAEQLVEHFQTEQFKLTVHSSLKGAIKDTNLKFDLIVNASAIGMSGETEFQRLPLDGYEDLVTNRPVVYDLVYSPAQTEFLKSLASVSSKASNGISMLIYQGAVGFEIMFGKKAPTDVMFQSLEG